MKIKFLFTLVLACVTWPALAQDKAKQDPPIPALPKFTKEDPHVYGRQLAEYAELYDTGWKDEILKGQMTLFDASGDSVTRSFARMVYEHREKGAGDKIIIKFLKPAELAGVAALTFENPGSSDDNWLWLPASKRTRRIAGANNTASFQGTEFTYEDLGSIDPSEYVWRFVEETTLKRGKDRVPVYKLSATPTYKNTGYSRIVLYVHREHWRHERIEYYDKAGRLLKTRKASGWKLFHNRFWRAMRLDMSNHQTGKRTLLDISGQQVSLHRHTHPKTGKPRSNLSEDIFTTRALTR